METNSNLIENYIELYGDKLLRVSYAITNDYQFAEDIVQEVFIKAYTNMDKFKGKSSVYTWLYKITINLCRKKIKKLSWKNIFPADDLDKKVDPYNTIDQKQNEMVVVKAIQTLDHSYREILVLYYYEGFSIKEISNILGVKEGTVKSKLSRGRKKLKTILVKEGFDG